MEIPTNKIQNRGHEQTLTNKRPRRSVSPPPAAAGPRWLILNSCIDDVCGDSSAKTAAASCTSSGTPFSISFGIAAPPACCSVHFDWLSAGTPGDSDDGTPSKPKPNNVRIIAGHDDALLFKIKITSPEARHTFHDYFLYEAGGGGAWPPSLSLLPGFNVPVQSGYRKRKHRDRTPSFRNLDMKNTGILRRGEDDLVVCQFEMACHPPVYTAELCMLRVGHDREWIVIRRVPIVEHRDGSSELQPWHRRRSLVPNAAVPVGNRFLCWVNYSDGFLVCDMADDDETPKIRYVPVPATQHDGYCEHYPREMRAHYTLGAAGADAVRFVSVSTPRCWRCYVPDETSCEGSSSSFKVTTWTMTLSTEEATTWVKDAVLHCDEIWKWRRLPNYGCFPPDKHLEYPMVNSDDPDVIYFKVGGMAVAINVKSKKLLSVVLSGTRDLDEDEVSSHLVTAKLCW